jgi:hypothetical protein
VISYHDFAEQHSVTLTHEAYATQEFDLWGSALYNSLEKENQIKNILKFGLWLPLGLRGKT